MQDHNDNDAVLIIADRKCWLPSPHHVFLPCNHAAASCVKDSVDAGCHAPNANRFGEASGSLASSDRQPMNLLVSGNLGVQLCRWREQNGLRARVWTYITPALLVLLLELQSPDFGTEGL